MAEVGVTELRRDLKRWLSLAQGGEEVLVTDRGTPVARLIGVSEPSALERLQAAGRISAPRTARVHAGGTARVRGGPASELVVEERARRRR
jgi:prevent-host-death family protein